jgi:hypothetical protein
MAPVIGTGNGMVVSGSASLTSDRGGGSSRGEVSTYRPRTVRSVGRAELREEFETHYLPASGPPPGQARIRPPRCPTAPGRGFARSVSATTRGASCLMAREIVESANRGMLRAVWERIDRIGSWRRPMAGRG